MKYTTKLLSVVLVVCMILCAFVACTPEENEPEHVDYAASVKLDMNSSTLKEEVTVKSYIDGDTTHFHVPASVSPTRVLKARYLAINTPESTGKIEEWGKKASNFTKEKLQNATSIIIESDNGTWNPDSTGGRYLVWVWYKTADSADYRNLNIEILQNGLAIASNSAQNRYGETCVAAINQAKAEKLCVYSNEKDPDFYYGTAIELDLRELRTNIESYDGQKVAFNGIVTRDSGGSVYIESYDEETGLYYGISAYYGTGGLTGKGLEIISIGNEVRIVGTVSYWAEGGVYQISDLKYRAMKPSDPENIQKISDGNDPAYVLTPADTFANGKVEVTVGDETKSFDYAELTLDTTIKMENLVVKSCYTTDDDASSSKGAITLTCEVDGVTVSVRTNVLFDGEGNIVTQDFFEGKTITVKGLVGSFKGSYQIKVLTLNDITILN